MGTNKDRAPRHSVTTVATMEINEKKTKSLEHHSVYCTSMVLRSHQLTAMAVHGNQPLFCAFKGIFLFSFRDSSFAVNKIFPKLTYLDIRLTFRKSFRRTIWRLKTCNLEKQKRVLSFHFWEKLQSLGGLAVESWRKLMDLPCFCLKEVYSIVFIYFPWLYYLGFVVFFSL